MRIGLFGFPLTGKSTLFRLLTGAPPPPHGGRAEAQVGVAKVPDPRLDKLAAMHRPKKVTPAVVEYMDLAGVEKGDAADALPLDQLRTVDALAHVVRGFRDDAVPHVEGTIDPARDAATMEMELLLADHTIAEPRLEKLEPLVKKANKEDDRKDLETLRKCLQALEREIPLRNLEFTADEAKRLRGFTFLSLKPLLVAVNADEADAGKLAGGASAFGLESLVGKPWTEVVAFSAAAWLGLVVPRPVGRHAGADDRALQHGAVPAIHRDGDRLPQLPVVLAPRVLPAPGVQPARQRRARGPAPRRTAAAGTDGAGHRVLQCPGLPGARAQGASGERSSRWRLEGRAGRQGARSRHLGSEADP